jgi:hypothetical protein
MKTLLQPTIILLLYICVRCTDLAITAAMGKSTIRAVAYAIVALLSLIALIWRWCCEV